VRAYSRRLTTLYELERKGESVRIVMQAFAALGHGIQPRLLDDPVITGIAKRVHKTPAQVLLAWAVQRITAPLRACPQSSIPIALPRQPYLAQHARGCAECHYQASVRSDSLAEQSEFKLPVPVSKLSDDNVVL
jgi:hypothetical protein